MHGLYEITVLLANRTRTRLFRDMLIDVLNIMSKVNQNLPKIMTQFSIRLLSVNLCLPLQLALWDTAGVEKFKTMTRNYYRNTHAALLVYDVNNPASLQYLAKWANDVIEYAPNG